MVEQDGLKTHLSLIMVVEAIVGVQTLISELLFRCAMCVHVTLLTYNVYTGYRN